jgi:hypothetical protein
MGSAATLLAKNRFQQNKSQDGSVGMANIDEKT